MAVKNHITKRRSPRRGTISETTPTEIISGRKKLLEITDTLIQETYDRISGDRFRLREGDRERLAYLKTLISLIVLYDSLLKGSKAPTLEGLDSESIELKISQERESAQRQREFNEMIDSTLIKLT